MPRKIGLLARLVAGLVGFLTLASATCADATGTIHIEWLRGGYVYSSEEISATSTSVASSASPAMGGTAGTARITAVAGAVVIKCGGTAPVATQTNGLRLEIGQAPMTCAVVEGEKIAIIEATTGPSGGSAGGGGAVTQSGTWTVQPGNTANTTPWLTTPGGPVADNGVASGNPVPAGCDYNLTPPTYASADRATLQCDVRGNTKVFVVGVNVARADDVTNASYVLVSTPGASGALLGVANSLFDGTNLDSQRSIVGSLGVATGVAAVEAAGSPFSHIATNTTTTVKSGAGIFHKMCVGTKGASANTATIYDNTAGSGTVIAIVDTVNITSQCLQFDLAFATGLTVVTATGTAADLTFVYR